MSQENIAENTFDVFLCYNREDETAVKKIGEQLRKKGIKPWLDIWEIPPGRTWQDKIEQHIKNISVAAVFVGEKGIGPWHRQEIQALLLEFVKRDRPVIPVILEDAPTKPELPLFLEGRRWVDFRILKENHELASDEELLNLLIWGITERREGKSQLPLGNDQIASKQHTLIALLGESPVAITALYDILTQREELTIDQMVILHSGSEEAQHGYNLIERALTDECKLDNEIFSEEVNSWLNACLFLKKLYRLLEYFQAQGIDVYFSLTSNSESMTTLVASIASCFSCVQHLYHVIDLDSEHFLSVAELEDYVPPSEHKQAMHPDLKQITLVNIPFASRTAINQPLIDSLLTTTEDEMIKMQEVWIRQTASLEGKILDVSMTERAIKQLNTLHQYNREIAEQVQNHLKHMRYTKQLRRSSIQMDSYNYHWNGNLAESFPASIDLHSFKEKKTSVHIVFYTHPSDIYTTADDDVKQVVICELDNWNRRGYKSLQTIATSPHFSIKPTYSLETSTSVDSILIVPLYKTAMVATQLYTLLKYQEMRNIHQVILVYPERSGRLAREANLIEQALKEEANIPCSRAIVLNWKDIHSLASLRQYQLTLEGRIDQARLLHPNCVLDLAFSGIQESIIAITIFAARNKHLSYIYSMAINDEELSSRIDRETTFKVLTNPAVGSESRNNRLFLREYENEEVYGKLMLFKLPVFY